MKKQTTKKTHISHSQIAMGKCLFKYNEVYVKKKYDEENEPMKAGHCAHNIIYEYTDFLYTNKIDSDYEAMVEIIDKNFDNYNMSETMYKDMRKALLEFGERGLQIENVLGYEKLVDVEIVKGVKVKAVVDRINAYQHETYGSCLEIIDYKNQMNILNKTDVAKLEQLQLYKYLLCNFEMTGFSRVRVGIHHIRYNHVVFSDWEEVDKLDSEFSNMEAYLIRQHKRLKKSKEYEARRGVACFEYGGCPVLLAKKCPLFKDAEVNKILKGKNIEETIRLMRQAQVVVANCKAKLKDITKETSLEVDGIFYGYQANEKVSYIVDHVMEYLLDRGIPVHEIKDWNKRSIDASLKNILGRDGFNSIKDDLNGFIRYEKTTRFKS